MAKRMPMREKAPNKAYNASVPFPRIWTGVDEDWSRVSDGRGFLQATYSNKIEFFLEHKAALLDKFPLSADAQAQALACPALPAGVTMRQLRQALRTLPRAPAHSVKYNGKWRSLGKEVRLAVSKLSLPRHRHRGARGVRGCAPVRGEPRRVGRRRHGVGGRRRNGAGPPAPAPDAAFF